MINIIVVLLLMIDDYGSDVILTVIVLVGRAKRIGDNYCDDVSIIVVTMA